MNALQRFIRLGFLNADERVAAALAPRRFEAANRYLQSSAVIRLVETICVTFESAWPESWLGRTAAAMRDSRAFSTRPARYQALGAVLLVAMATHVSLTVLDGLPPGWFWTLIPAMLAAVGALLFAGGRSTHFSE